MPKLPPRQRPRPERPLRLKSGGKWPIPLFTLKFAVLLGLFYLLPLAPCSQRVLSGYLRGIAGMTGALLRVLGEASVAEANGLSSASFSLTVGSGCSALEFVWFLAAAVVAFPAPWGKRVVGLALGLVMIVALNVIRVGSLYLLGVHWPALFAVMHESVWPAALVVATAAAMGAWVAWVGGARARTEEALA